MRWLLATVALAVLGALAWSVAQVLSPDAIGIVLGLLFGLFATVPSMLLLLVSARRNQAQRDPYYPRPSVVHQPPAALLPPTTVIIVQLPDGTHTRAQVVNGQGRLSAGRWEEE